MKKTLFLAFVALATLSCSKDDAQATSNDPTSNSAEAILPSASGDLHADSLALVALYDATSGNNWARNNWKTAPISKWNGITIQQVNGTKRVVSLQLLSMNLDGELPAQIGSLSALQTLNLNENRSLRGTIPAELYNLKELTNLNLRFTAIVGELSDSICKLQKLDTLNLSKPFYYHNNVQLSGKLPQTLGMLKTLRYLNLDNNAFSGEVPTSIGNMEQLEILQLWHNNLSGALPTEIGNLKAIKVLFIGNNNLSGSIPASIGQLSTLKQLYLNDNAISGAIPEAIGNMASLIDLDLSQNKLSGSIPSTATKLKHLGQLHLNDNQLSGVLPEGICNENPLLTSLWIQNNNISGSIPELTGFTMGTERWFCSIVANNNRFSGDIPAWMVQYPEECRKTLLPQQAGYNFDNVSEVL